MQEKSFGKKKPFFFSFTYVKKEGWACEKNLYPRQQPYTCIIKNKLTKKKPFLPFLTYVKERRWGFICYVMKSFYNFVFHFLQDQRHIKNINSILSYGHANSHM
jgi:hypothetical protein